MSIKIQTLNYTIHCNVNELEQVLEILDKKKKNNIIPKKKNNIISKNEIKQPEWTYHEDLDTQIKRNNIKQPEWTYHEDLEDGCNKKKKYSSKEEKRLDYELETYFKKC